MKIAVIGTGFVGVVTSAVFAKLGHQVTGLDIDEKKIDSLNKSKVPFYEPGLEELLSGGIDSGNLKFTTSYEDAIAGSDIIFITVGTPSAPDGQADTQYVELSASELAKYLSKNTIVVVKSTVPPGFNTKLQKIISEITNVNFYLASVPEFLREGTAVEDTLHPDRVLIGASDEYAIEELSDLHRPLTDNIIIMKPESAQMAKYASNTYLATRITFINQIADLCEQNGADIEEVISGIGGDSRIGSHYWYPGLGYGGSCFPKDVKEIAAYSRAVGESDSLFIKIDELNENRISKLLRTYDEFVGGFNGKAVCVMGLSFKPDTNDIREAPALKVIPWLIKAGASVHATDPRAVEEAKKYLPDEVKYFDNAYEASSGSDIIMLLIEWKEYLGLDLNKLGQSMEKTRFFIDTRNQYDPSHVREAGFKYAGVGR